MLKRWLQAQRGDVAEEARTTTPILAECQQQTVAELETISGLPPG